jgi:hypothetical protein
MGRTDEELLAKRNELIARDINQVAQRVFCDAWMA